MEKKDLKPKKRKFLEKIKYLCFFLTIFMAYPWVIWAEPEALPHNTSFFLQPLSTIPRFEKIMAGKYIEDYRSWRFIYTLDPALQIWTWEYLNTHRPSYASFIALEPQSGKILVLADYAQENPSYPGIWQKASYPAASIFKLVTAAGALEKGILAYNSTVFFRGNQYLLTPQKLQENKRERRINFAEAFGKSNNVVFGRVASKLLGAQSLRQFSAAFGFNQSLPFDYLLERSKALIPEESYELARCGAGLGEITLNPLHAAMIAGIIANRGVLMRPYLIAAIHNHQHQKIYEAKPVVIGQPISSKTAADLTGMMIRTVEDGTAAKTFQPTEKKFFKKITICGKTGHLSGQNPPGLYDWFIGFAPVENPRIAFSALTINQNGQRVKGTILAREFLKEFFRDVSN